MGVRIINLTGQEFEAKKKLCKNKKNLQRFLLFGIGPA
jgi:hypothetical protein